MELADLLKNAPDATAGQKKLLAALQKRYKSEVIYRLSDEDFVTSDIQRFSSGELGLDIALGGGWHRGRIHKIVGRWSSGKSSLAAAAIAEITRRHQQDVLLVDYEGAYTKRWLLAKGADITRVTIAKPSTAEMALDIAESGMLSGEFALVVLDSIASMSPKAELEASHDDWQQGLLARLVGKFCRKVDSHLNRLYLKGRADISTLMLINQIRTNTQARFHKDFTPGGTQQDNHSTTITDLFRLANIHEGESATTPAEDRVYVGWRTAATITKNKIDPPLKKTVFGILNEPYLEHPGHTFYHADTILRFSLKLDLVSQSGAWYHVAGTPHKHQGGVRMKTAIMADDDLRHHLVEGIKSSLSSIPIQFNSEPLEPIEIDSDASVLEEA